MAVFRFSLSDGHLVNHRETCRETNSDSEFERIRLYCCLLLSRLKLNASAVLNLKLISGWTDADIRASVTSSSWLLPPLKGKRFLLLFYKKKFLLL